MRDDHRLDRVGRDPEGFQAFAGRLRDGALALGRHGRIKTGIDHEGAVGADDRPDVEIERLEDVVGIPANEILGRAAVVMSITDRIDLVLVLAAHGVPLLVPSGRLAGGFVMVVLKRRVGTARVLSAPGERVYALCSAKTSRA